MERLAREAPGVALDFLPLADDPDELLQRGEIDFLVLPEMYMSRSHPRAALFEEKLVCVGCRTNKQLSRKLTFEKYMSMGHVAAKFGRTRRPPIEEWFLIEHGFKRRLEVVVQSFSMIPPMLLGTGRIGTMPSLLARHFGKTTPLRIVDLPLPVRLSPRRSNGRPFATPIRQASGCGPYCWSRPRACLWRAPRHQLARPFPPSSE